MNSKQILLGLGLAGVVAFLLKKRTEAVVAPVGPPPPASPPMSPVVSPTPLSIDNINGLQIAPISQNVVPIFANTKLVIAITNSNPFPIIGMIDGGITNLYQPTEFVTILDKVSFTVQANSTVTVESSAFSFSVEGNRDVRVRLYNPLGQQVKALVFGGFYTN